MAIQWCQGRVQHKQIWTEGLFTLHVEVDGVKPFEAGQFVQLGVHGTDKELIYRPYSIASPHGRVLEFYIVRVDGGQLTPLLDRIEIGEPVVVSDRAAGSFTLKKTPAAERLWLLATGTGLAPYVAMLRTEEPWQRFKKIVVVHGVRFSPDLSYQQEFERYAAEYPDQFLYLPTLTRESVNGRLSGRISTLIENGLLESTAGLEIRSEDSVVMLCGNPAMLDQVETILGERGMKKHRAKAPGHIVLERYW